MTEQTEPLINLTIDGKKIQVPKGTTIYHAATQIGIEIPIFCYMDRMPPFGACRMCLVEVEKMGKLQTACTLEATEGMVVNTQSGQAIEGRKGILEFLLINHPLDCPICDRGGECPLQDNTLKFGPGKSEFHEEKRHFKKPLPLGPVLMLDRERCITCARCTRFGEIIAGDHALEFVQRGYRTEVGTNAKSGAESKFIGNTIKICPVGALTSQAYRFRARPWDNDSQESTCTLCPVGCSFILDSRDGEIVRTRSLENKAVNDLWLCDKGWFGYEFVYHEERLKTPLIKNGEGFEAISWEAALELIANKIWEAVPQGRLAAFGGDPLTFQENFLFQDFVRTCMGVNHIDHRIGTPIIAEEQEGIAPGMEMQIGECEELSYAYLLGLDLTEEFPVIWLRLKQAINRGAKVIFIGHYAPEISPYLSKTILHSPNEEIEMLKKEFAEIQELAKEGRKGALFVGRQYLAKQDRRAIVEELVTWKENISDLSLNIMEGRGGSLGAREAGIRPDLGPFGKKLEKPGLNAIQVLEEAAQSQNGWDFLLVAGADPATKFPASLWKKARKALKFLVVQDLFLTETAKQADIILPTLSFLEKEGNFINIERRIEKIYPGKTIPQELLGDGAIFMRLAHKLGKEIGFDTDFTKSLRSPFLPSKKTFSSSSNVSEKKIEGDFFATFAPSLFDHGVRFQKSAHVAHLAKEPFFRIHPAEAKRLGIEEGDLISLSIKEKKIRGKVKLDEKVALKTVVIPVGFPQIPAHELGPNLLNGVSVNICP